MFFFSSVIYAKIFTSVWKGLAWKRKYTVIPHCIEPMISPFSYTLPKSKSSLLLIVHHNIFSFLFCTIVKAKVLFFEHFWQVNGQIGKCFRWHTSHFQDSRICFLLVYIFPWTPQTLPCVHLSSPSSPFSLLSSKSLRKIHIQTFSSSWRIKIWLSWERHFSKWQIAEVPFSLYWKKGKFFFWDSARNQKCRIEL